MTIAGPSARHFIREPDDRATTTHPYTVMTTPSKQVEKQASMPVPSKVIALDKDVEESSSRGSAGAQQSKLIGKSRHN